MSPETLACWTEFGDVLGIVGAVFGGVLFLVSLAAHLLWRPLNRPFPSPPPPRFLEVYEAEQPDSEGK